MELSGILLAGAFAIALLVALDWGIWWKACLGLSMDYEAVEWWSIRRTFPRRVVFQVTKLIVGLGFVVSFILTVKEGAREHLGLAGVSFALLIVFGILAFIESVKAFRYFAAHNPPSLEKGGYRDR